MSTPFQNRLVGTIIIAAVAIIFLPDLLDGDKKTYQEEFERIPPAPKVDFSPQKQAFPEDKLSQLPTDNISDEVAVDELANEKINSQAQQNSDNSQEQKSATLKVSALAKEQIPQQENDSVSQPKTLPERAIAKQAWAIQLGSFRHKNNVDELVDKLKNNGYTVFTKPIKTKNGKLTKVFVGPELIKSSLEKKLPKLKQLTNVQGKVARFMPASG